MSHDGFCVEQYGGNTVSAKVCLCLCEDCTDSEGNCICSDCITEMCQATVFELARGDNQSAH